MRASVAMATAGCLIACVGTESAPLRLEIATPECDRPRCVAVLQGQGLYVISAEPTGSDALASQSGMLTFFGETRTSSATTVVVEIAFEDDGTPVRARYREIGEGRHRFKANVEDLEGVPSSDQRRHFRLTAINQEDPDDVRLVEGWIGSTGAVVIEGSPDPDSGGCGGEVDTDVHIYVPTPTPTPSPTPKPSPTPDPSPDPEMPVSTDDGCSGGDPGPTEPSTEDTGGGCEGDSSTTTASGGGCEGDSSTASSSSCEGDSAGSSSSSSCEGDTASSSSSSCDGGSSSSAASSSCDGDVASAVCVPMIPWERIFGSLFRMFGPVSLVGWWNRRRRGDSTR